jgi:two-component system, LytTR family, sensor kinase
MLKSFRSWKFWGALLGAATLIGLAEATQLYASTQATPRPMAFSRAASATMPSWFVLAILLPGVMWLCDRFRLDRGSWRKALVVHVPASALFAVLAIGIASWLSDFVFYDDFPLGYIANLKRLLGVYFILDVTYYWAMVGAFYAIDYQKKYREHERAVTDLALKASRLEGSLARANLETLRMQLNPHFLFNTLNAISVLALKGERQNVVRMLTRLSDLLRLALENSQQVVTLEEDLAFLDPYLEIEKVRFRDRLQVVIDVPPETLDAEVPSLLLQPPVENAVRHGIAQRTGPGIIEVRAFTADSRLFLEVRDSGPGFSPDHVANGERTGVGLANTRARLEQLYGGEHRLETVNAPGGGAIVRVVIPFRPFEGDRVTDAGSYENEDETEARTA